MHILSERELELFLWAFKWAKTRVQGSMKDNIESKSTSAQIKSHFSFLALLTEVNLIQSSLEKALEGLSVTLSPGLQ
jgi:hypothetical protein